MDNLISIIVPVYNVESYLRKCIESILNQTYKNLQIILIDDGSPDNSGAICDEYAAKDNRIEVVHKANGGVTSARKAGLELAKGDYIGFVDSDDWIESNMYEEMLENLLQTNADMVHTGYICEKPNNMIYSECSFDTTIIVYPDTMNLWKYLIGTADYPVLHPSLIFNLFNRKLITHCLKNVPDEIFFGEDRISLIEYMLNSKRISLLKKAYYHYVMRDGSYTSVHNATRMIWIAKMFEQVEKLFYKYNIHEQMESDFYAIFTKYMLMEIIQNPVYADKIPMYGIRNIDELRNKRIIIYGAGKVGHQYYKQLSAHLDIQIVDWVDKNFSKYNYKEREIHSVESLKVLDYDVVLIAVKREGLANQMMNDLIVMNVDKSKLYWKPPINLIFSA